MTQTVSQPGFTQETFDAFLQARDEPHWLREQRKAAWQSFLGHQMPSTNEEEWRRTDIRLLRLERFGLAEEPAGETQMPVPLLSRGVELGGRSWTHNSRSVVSELAESLSVQGVLFGSLDQLVAEHGDLIQPHLHTKAVDPRFDKFSALHAAFWSGGTLLYVPRGVHIEQPLHVFSALADGGVDLSHVLVVLEEGAEATLLIETDGDESECLHCGAIEVLQGPRSRLRLVSLQDWGSRTWHFAHQKAIVDTAGHLQWTIGALGGRLAKVNQHVALVGQDAETQVNGVMFTEGKQHLSYHTLQHHEAPYCNSDLLYKGALQDKSRVVWRGMIRVDKEAQRTNAYQRDDNLLLSETARADSIPGLEIEADDVRCTHGATAGRVDEEQIFYARCRGYTRNEAVRMIVAGFFQKVFDRITIESVKDALAEAIGRRIRHFD